MNELNRHKRNNKIKWVCTGVAFVLIFVFIAGLCMQLFAKDDKYKPSEWFKKTETEQTTPVEGDEESKESSSVLVLNDF